MTADSTIPIPGRKSALREQVRQRLKILTVAQRVENSQRARDILEQTGFWNRARNILFYAPFDSELDIWPLVPRALELAKQVFLPRFHGHACYEACLISRLTEDIVPGRFGIREGAWHCPAGELNRLDLALVPGVAFDLQGRRLGRGKGFYDRLLAAVTGTKCGVAFDEQLVASVPVEPHDVFLNCILTPTRCIEL